MALPLALSLVLHLSASRGSRLGLVDRLNEARTTSLVASLSIIVLISAFLVGLFARPWLLFPFAVGTFAASLAAAWDGDSPKLAWSMVLVLALAVFSGVLVRQRAFGSVDHPLNASRDDLASSSRSWKIAASMIKAYPLVGVGLGGYSSAEPYFKNDAVSTNVAQSSLLQWIAETGAPGAALLCILLWWSIAKLPEALKSVGAADRRLAFGVAAAGLGAFLFAAVHWSVESVPVALSASLLAGIWHRWSCGATDLFVDLV